MIKSTHTKGQWSKGVDFIDNTPRYTLFVPGAIEGTGHYCDSKDSPLRWHAVVYGERERAYPGGPKRMVYYGTAEDCHTEASAQCNGYRTAKQARDATEMALQELMLDAEVLDNE